MSIMKYALEQGTAIGIEQGRKEGIRLFIEASKELNVPREDVLRKVEEKFALSHEQAIIYMAEIYDIRS